MVTKSWLEEGGGLKDCPSLRARSQEVPDHRVIYVFDAKQLNDKHTLNNPVRPFRLPPPLEVATPVVVQAHVVACRSDVCVVSYYSCHLCYNYNVVVFNAHANVPLGKTPVLTPTLLLLPVRL